MLLDRVATFGRLSGDVLSIATFGRIWDFFIEIGDDVPITGEMRTVQGARLATENAGRTSSVGGGRMGSESNSQVT